LHTCIEEALDLLAPKAAEKTLDLAYLVHDAIPKILISDVTRLRQILVNLISNAVKFTHQGEVVVEVAPAARSPRSPEPGGSAAFTPPQRPTGHDTEFLRHPEAGRSAALTPLQRPGDHDTEVVRRPDEWLLHFSVRDTGI